MVNVLALFVHQNNPNTPSHSVGLSSKFQTIQQRGHKAPLRYVPRHSPAGEPGRQARQLLSARHSNSVRCCEAQHKTRTSLDLQTAQLQKCLTTRNSTSNTSDVLLTNLCVTSNIYMYSVSSNKFFLSFSLFFVTSLNSVSSFCNCS